MLSSANPTTTFGPLCQDLDKNAPIAFLSDYDGTLAPIVSQPDKAFILPGGHELLDKLIDHPQVQLAIVSGRSVEVLQSFLGSALCAKPLWLCGLHGGQLYNCETQSFLASLDSTLNEQIAVFKSHLMNALEEKQLLSQGLLIEDKTISLALHTRNASGDIDAQAMAIMQDVFTTVLGSNSGYRLQTGKRVLEAVPSGFNKGLCVEILAQHWQSPDAPAMQWVYVGDDDTDEAAFKAVNKLNGLSIRVGDTSKPTTAKYSYESINEYYKDLKKLF